MREIFRAFVKWLICGIVFGIVLLAIGGVLLLLTPKEIPAVTAAPWAIQTYSNDKMLIPSRVYVAEKYSYANDGVLIISGYWSFDEKNWIRHNGSLTLKGYGKIDITRRAGE